ncbi:hypothetical protein GCM10010402_38160 [Actinomadura luteofluorescens]
MDHGVRPLDGLGDVGATDVGPHHPELGLGLEKTENVTGSARPIERPGIDTDHSGAAA